jgi:hypothetical protein
MTDTNEKVEEGFKKTTHKITDSDTSEKNNAENKSVGKEPMNLEDIA